MNPQKDIFSRPGSWLWLFVFWSLPAIPIEFSAHLSKLIIFRTGGWVSPEELRVQFYGLLRWWIWIPITPALLRLNWRYPLVGQSSSAREFLRPTSTKRLAKFRTKAQHLAMQGVGSLLASIFVICFHHMLTLLFFGENNLIYLAGRSTDRPSEVLALFWSNLWSALGVYILVATVAHGWRFYDQARERQIQLTEARLTALRAQIHPHFLFNTLNSVSALMEDDVPATRRVIDKLGQILRASLEEPPGELVALDDEARLARLYLEIEEVRFGDRLTVEVDIADDVKDAAVPHLLLQPLIENAVRHGIGRRSDARLIRLAAASMGSQVEITIEDDGPGPEAVQIGPKGSGIGLKNVRARLMQLYGDDALLELKSRLAGGALCRVMLPYSPLDPDHIDRDRELAA